nr:uncharacterized protein LOC107401767 [Peromyscus maniculatus bairdii]
MGTIKNCLYSKSDPAESDSGRCQHKMQHRIYHQSLEQVHLTTSQEVHSLKRVIAGKAGLTISLVNGAHGASPGLLNTKEALRGGARSCEPPGIRCRLGEGVDPETRRPERHRGVSPPSPRWAPAEDWSQTPHSPSPTRSRKLSPSPYLPAATKLWSVHTPLCCPRSPNSIKSRPIAWESRCRLPASPEPSDLHPLHRMEGAPERSNAARSGLPPREKVCTF